MTHSFYLQMYLDNTLVDEVPLNYNGLQSSEEQQWYHLGAVQDLRELHEVLLMGSETEPVFVIRNPPLLLHNPRHPGSIRLRERHKYMNFPHRYGGQR